MVSVYCFVLRFLFVDFVKTLSLSLQMIVVVMCHKNFNHSWKNIHYSAIALFALSLCVSLFPKLLTLSNNYHDQDRLQFREC